jgi:hypothetical protein
MYVCISESFYNAKCLIYFYTGLRNIYEIVSQGQTELRLDLTAAGGEHVYETFQNFHLSDSPYYTLHIDKGVGTAGDK